MDAGAANLPNISGAYGLLIDVARPVRLSMARRAVTLPAGRYLYAGSAWGPRGIRARVGRHLRKEKKIRWHVDNLTNRHGVVMVLVVPGGQECALVTAICAWSGVETPVPGFGSSDCRTCQSHLVRLPDALEPGETVAAMTALAAVTGNAVFSLDPSRD